MHAAISLTRVSKNVLNLRIVYSLLSRSFSTVQRAITEVRFQSKPVINKNTFDCFKH